RSNWPGSPTGWPGQGSRWSAAGGTGSSARSSTWSARTAHWWLARPIRRLGQVAGHLPRCPWPVRILTPRRLRVPGFDPTRTGLAAATLSGTATDLDTAPLDLLWPPDDILAGWRG